MSKPAAIILAVAGYSIAETILLLSVDAPHPLYNPTSYQNVAIFGQLLLIPGMAALMSRVMYGPYQWRRRTLTILLYGVLSIPVAIISFVLILLPVWILVSAYEVSWILLALALPVVMLGVVIALVFLVRSSGSWTAKAEAWRWLAERRAGTPQSDRLCRGHSIRFAVCIPILIVLPVFLFLPETWGVLTQVTRPSAHKISGYQVPVPLTWIVLNLWVGSDGTSSFSGVAGRGIGFGQNPLRYDALSAWDFWTESTNKSDQDEFDWKIKEDDILGRQTVKAGTQELKCVDYWPPWGIGRSAAVNFAHVRCSGNNRLHATFDGRRDLLPKFYQVLSSIKPSD